MNFKRNKQGHGVLFFITALILILLALLFFFLRPDGDPVPQGGSSVNLENSSDGTDSGESSTEELSSQSVSDDGSSSGEPSSEPEEPAGGEPGDSQDDTVTLNGVTYSVNDLPEGSPDDWNLILLNPAENNKIDSELDVNLTRIDSQYVDERAAVYYNEMKAAAAESGITLFLRSGYRSIKEQQTNYNNSVANYRAQGYSEEEAIRLTNQYYTVPGHSEHHSGLAFDTITPQYHNDIYQLDDRFADTEAYAWLKENCAEYGFILRYPREKQDVTRINFEPWHYRYVGKEHAEFMMENNLCLEEYIQLLQLAGR